MIDFCCNKDSKNISVSQFVLYLQIVIFKATAELDRMTVKDQVQFSVGF